MPHYNIKHKNKYYVFSTVVDAIIYEFDTFEELQKYRLEEYGKSNFKDIKTFEELKRYPTADEVCKALNMEYKNHVMFDVDYKQFIVTMTQPIVMQYEITEYKNGCVRIQPDYLKPHLITLIGRFYQGLEESKKCIK